MSDETPPKVAPEDAAPPVKRKRGRPRKPIDPNVLALLEKQRAEDKAAVDVPLGALSIREIKALSSLAAGGSMREAARVMGCDEKTMRQYLVGREKAVLRSAYQRLLVHMGITPERLAKVYDDALSATKKVYNVHGELTSEYPDHGIRLKAAMSAEKILQVAQPTELSARAPDDDGLGRIGWDTTLGDGKTIDQDGYEVPAAPGPVKQLN